MLGITFQYIPYDTDIAFLRIKQDEIVLDYYRWAFFAHSFLNNKAAFGIKIPNAALYYPRPPHQIITGPN